MRCQDRSRTSCRLSRERSDRRTDYSNSQSWALRFPDDPGIHRSDILYYWLPVVEPAAGVPENIRVAVVVYYYPEAVVLGYQDGLLAVRLRIDAHGVVVHHVGTVRVKVNPNGIEPSSLQN